MEKTPSEIIEKINKERPLKGSKNSKAILYRSKLNEYEKKFGMPYKVPEGFEIIEDVT